MKKQKILSVVGLLLIVVTFVAMHALPELLGFGATVGGAFKAMAFITAGSEYKGKENMDIVLRPRFFGTKPQEMGIRIIDSQGASTVKLNFFGKILKVLMPYASGFQGGGKAPQLQKKLTLAEFKAEAAYDKHDYANMIFEQIVDRGGIAQNDISGTDVFNAENTIFLNAVEGDVFANFWLGDKTKTMTRAGAYPDGTAYAAGDADKYYNQLNGICKAIMTDAYQSSVSKQGLIAGWNKTTYPTLYLANESNTVYAYDTAAHRTAVTTASRLFHFTGTTAGLKTLTADNTSGFSGSIYLEKATADATFELQASDFNYIKTLTMPTLTTDSASTMFNRLFRLATPELKALKKDGLLRFYCSDSVIYNYEDTLKAGTLESSKSMIIDGITRYAHNGIPIVPMGVDQLIEADFASTFPKDWIILSTPENFCLVINGSSSFAETRYWFNPDANQNRQRTQFEMGVDYILPELIVAAYA